MTDMTQGGAPLAATQDSYMAMVRQKRLYSGIAILVFVVLLVSGFRVANDRNAGGFFDGIHRIFDFPADVVGEAWEKRADMAGLLWKYLPDLIETLNIAAVATLLGAALGLVLSLLSTRGMARWPVLIPLFRRIMDVTRALPEIVVALVLIYMLFYYRVFGIVANIALSLNLMLLIACMSILSATLTLPGIAGIVLTLGMAVDANVLIFSRIREEIFNGMSPQRAVHEGFDKAFSAIIDGNLTTLLVGVILFAMGSGPIKGFAVTLSLGIVTSMFSAIMVTRAMVNLAVGGRDVKKLWL